MIRRQRNLVRADEQDPVPAGVHDGVVADDGGLAAEAVGDDAVLACPGHVHASDLEPYTWIRRGERWGRRAVGRAEKARDDPVGADILNRTGVNGQRRVDAIDAVLAGIAYRGIVGGPVVTRPVAVTDPPLIVIGPPSDLTTSPAPTIRFFAWIVRPPSSK